MQLLLDGHSAVQAFEAGHDENFTAPWGGANCISNCAEEIRSIAPLENRFTYEYEGDTLTMVVDDELEVTEDANG